MGCASSSTGAKPLPAALAEANRQFFGLGELPVTITSTVKNDVLDVRVAGLDQPGILPALERGFHRRHMFIDQATIFIEAGMFHGVFHLKQVDSGTSVPEAPDGDGLQKPPSNKVEIVPLKVVEKYEPPPTSELNRIKDQSDVIGQKQEAAPVDSFLRQISGLSSRSGRQGGKEPETLFLGSVDDLSADSTSRLAEADARAAAQGACLRFTVKRAWSVGIRVALHRMVELAGFSVRLARLSTTKSWGSSWIDDTLWLAAGADMTKDFEDISRDALPPWVAGLIERLEFSNVEHSIRSNLSCFSRVNLDDVDVKMKSAYKTERMAEIPDILVKKAYDIPYWLIKSTQGMDYSAQGIDKFCGSGMTKTYRNVEVLEFSSYFVLSQKEQKSSRMSAALKALVTEEKRYAEFVTQYDPKAKTLTIFKVFLNGVLPAGQNCGVIATAEQMMTIQVQAVNGTKASTTAAWDGVAAIRGLKAIWLCDVVNWNTYCLLSMVGRDTSSETEEWLLNEEVKASKLTRKELKEGTVKAIFLKTALGKVVDRMLKHWQEKDVANLKIEEVRIVWDEGGQMESIHGEFRRLMDVEVLLSPAA